MNAISYRADCSSNFQRAVAKYIGDLPDKDRDKSFISICQTRCGVVSSESLDADIKAIKATCSQRSKIKQKVADVFEAVVLALRDYGGIINTFSTLSCRHLVHLDPHSGPSRSLS